MTTPSTAHSATLDPARAPAAIADFIAGVRPAIDAELDRRLAAGPLARGDEPVGRLIEAMRYAAIGPGKRLRPALCVAACEAVGGSRSDALPAAAALELLHAYTLVHDDLPAMDDDEMRRGRPTVHVAFGEATAILAGDGLLTAAFGALADLGPRAAAAVAVLAARAGWRELLAGQARDLAQAAAPGGAAAEPPTLAALERVHAGKTGALFSAAAELGAIAAGAAAAQRDALARYGMAIGVAFQHADDRDDGEHQALAVAASRRIAELAREAAAIAGDLRPGSPALVALATWIGSTGTATTGTGTTGTGTTGTGTTGTGTTGTATTDRQ